MKNQDLLEGILVIAMWLVIIIVISLSVYLWQFADCETIKALNTTAPGRCIRP